MKTMIHALAFATPSNMKTRMKTKSLVLGVVAAGALVLVTEARANTVTGSLWEGISDTLPADLAHLPGGAATVTFTAPSPLNFDSRTAVNGYTIGGWLATGGGSITGGTAGHGLLDAGLTMDDTFVLITGQVTVTSGQSFTVEHDDGMTLVINGQTVISAPNATAPTPTTGTYSGAAGTWNFELYYDEVQGAPAVLQVDLPLQTQAVPDGGTTVALLGMGLAGLAGLARRVRAS